MMGTGNRIIPVYIQYTYIYIYIYETLVRNVTFWRGRFGVRFLAQSFLRNFVIFCGIKSFGVSQ